MTAIALLNSEKESHIIADILLNTDGPVLSQKKFDIMISLNLKWNMTHLL